MRILKSLTAVFLVLPLFLLSGCSDEELIADILVYENDFEDMDITGINGAEFLNFDQSIVIGRYNNDGFRLSLNDIPEHDFLYISFDLLLHDTWDGNTNGFDPDFPDLWTMEFNKDLNIRGTIQPKLQTTFSNGPCDSQLCLTQSYPQSYPHIFNPKSGFDAFTWGACERWWSQTGTSIVKIQRTYPHKDKALIIDFYDSLYQPNVTSPECDESWSLDNLVVRALIVE